MLSVKKKEEPMPFLAERLKRIKPSPTIAVTTKAKELQAAGKDVIGLGAGEPDFDTPDNIKDFAIKSIQKGDTKYTAVDGTPALKKAICEKFKRENSLTYTPDQITVGNGGKQVIFNILLATINPGDEVIIPSPYWVSYPDIVEFSEGKPVFVECSEENGFRMQPEQLRKAITPRTKWVILNSPSNPTGAAYDRKSMKALTDVLLEFPHVHIMADDIYEHILYDGLEFVTPAQVEPKLFDRTVTVNGVSKSYSMTGWRIGYAGGSKDLMKAVAMLQSQSTSNPSSISQAAAVEALNGKQDFLKPRSEAFRKRRDFVVNGLNAIPGINCNKPEGAFYVFPSCKGLLGKKTASDKVIKTGSDFSEYLLEEALVAVVPGVAFGTDPFFRISYATSDEALDKALKRIKEACAKLT